MYNISMKPKLRSKYRVFLGKHFYRCLRRLKWLFGSEKYATQRDNKQLEFNIFEHATPVYRKLKDVDMWLQENKAHNLEIAIKRINGIILRPGETFSYWKLIGNPSKSKGYKEGMILYYGSYKAGVGGGLCQLSNLIFWMAIHTPLTVVERYRHSYDVFPDSGRTQPFGSGATCVYNYRDLVLRNDTDECYQINLCLEDDYLKGQVCSELEKYLNFEVYEASHEINHEYWGAYSRNNEIRRKISNIEGELLLDEKVCENHALMMYDPYIEYRRYSAECHNSSNRNCNY